MGLTVIRNVLLFDGESVHQAATVVFDAASGLITSVGTGTADTADATVIDGEVTADATVIDGQVTADATVIDGQVTADAAVIDGQVTADATVIDGQVTADATVIDGQGHTLLPGLIDAHVHCHDLHMHDSQDLFEVLRQPLRAGVTTVCDMHTDTETVHGLQQAVAAELDQARRDTTKGAVVTMADLKSSHLSATVKDGWPKPVVLGHNPSERTKTRVAQWPSVTPATAAAFVAEHRAAGADYIKLMQEDGCSPGLAPGSVAPASAELQAAVVRAAHAAGLQCYGHATSLASTALLLTAGVDGLTHTFIDRAPTRAIVDLYRARGAFVTPTLTVLASMTGGERALRHAFADLAFGRPGLIDARARDTARQDLGMAAPTASLQHAYASVVQLRRAGIDVVAGSDSAMGLRGTMLGPSLWLELYLYVQRCGFAPVEALASATAVTARRFAFHDRGRVRAGQRADLLLVDGDATVDIARLWQGRGIVGVWKAGIPALFPPSNGITVPASKGITVPAASN